MNKRPSTQLQQFVMILSAISSVSMFACAVFGLPVSATAYSIIKPKNAVAPTENCGAEANALHTTVFETCFFQNSNIKLI